MEQILEVVVAHASGTGVKNVESFGWPPLAA